MRSTLKSAFYRFFLVLVMGLVVFGSSCSNNPASTPSPSPSAGTSETSQPTLSAISTITAREAFNLIQNNLANPDFLILDVRTASEFAEGHIAGALNIDYYSAEFKTDIGKLDMDKQYLVYCRTGKRSAGAVQIMLDMGFKHVLNLDGGIVQWKSDGFGVE
jgi:rhodanese-related sulfurtransferase